MNWLQRLGIDFPGDRSRLIAAGAASVQAGPKVKAVKVGKHWVHDLERARDVFERDQNPMSKGIAARIDSRAVKVLNKPKKTAKADLTFFKRIKRFWKKAVAFVTGPIVRTLGRAGTVNDRQRSVVVVQSDNSVQLLEVPVTNNRAQRRLLRIGVALHGPAALPLPFTATVGLALHGVCATVMAVQGLLAGDRGLLALGARIAIRDFLGAALSFPPLPFGTPLALSFLALDAAALAKLTPKKERNLNKAQIPNT